MRVVIVNTGVGNVRSVANMMRRLDVNAEISDRPESILSAEALILPGVGSYDAAIRRFHAAGIVAALNEMVVARGVPMIGLCLGMQLLGEGSDEGQEPGFGWIPGRLTRLQPSANDRQRIRVPHMGWNIISETKDCVLYENMGEEPRFYFDHSYYFRLARPEHICGVVEYGLRFAAGVRRGNVFGVQFHPEKSHRFGLALFDNFLRHAVGCVRRPLAEFA